MTIAVETSHLKRNCAFCCNAFETCHFIPKEKYGLRVSENRALRGISRAKTGQKEKAAEFEFFIRHD
jgi:hypothetical protein